MDDLQIAKELGIDLNASVPSELEQGFKDGRKLGFIVLPDSQLKSISKLLSEKAQTQSSDSVAREILMAGGDLAADGKEQETMKANVQSLMKSVQVTK